MIADKPSFKEQEFNDLVKKQSNPMNSKLLFGHGLNQNDVYFLKSIRKLVGKKIVDNKL